MSWPFGRHMVLAVALPLLLSAPACSDPQASQPNGAAVTTTTSRQSSPTTSASPADVAGAKAIEVYKAMWADFVAAGRSSDWKSERLGHHATGIALTNMSRALYADKKNGLITKGSPELSPEVSSAEPSDDPTKVIVTDCGDSSTWLKYRKKDGKRASDSGGGRHRINAVVEKQSDGSWKVSDYGVHEVGSCG